MSLEASVLVALATILFLIGLRFSAFFSGSETGFYRISTLRLTIDAQQQDPVAQGLLWFARHPSYFVATTLVGGNVANYLCTFAISMAAARLAAGAGDWPEILLTILSTPVVFVWGGMIPKNLFYRAPMTLLRQSYGFFKFCYWCFLPATYPLVLITRLLERLTDSPDRQIDLVLGRGRLVQIVTEGHREGILHDVQSKLVHGTLQIAEQSVHRSMIPSSRVLGLSTAATREEILKFAASYGVATVALHLPDQPERWSLYVRVSELALEQSSLPELQRPMPVITPTTSKLEALLRLRRENSEFGVVRSPEDKSLGVITQQGLLEQLFRPPQSLRAEGE